MVPSGPSIQASIIEMTGTKPKKQPKWREDIQKKRGDLAVITEMENCSLSNQRKIHQMMTRYTIKKKEDPPTLAEIEEFWSKVWEDKTTEITTAKWIKQE